MSPNTVGKWYWHSTPPEKCQTCRERIEDEFVDGKTIFGRWGCICPDCHREWGRGLGLGRGQRYTKQADGRWLKTGG